MEALMAKQDKPVIYDLSTKIDEPKIEIEKFLTKFSPEKIRQVYKFYLIFTVCMHQTEKPSITHFL